MALETIGIASNVAGLVSLGLTLCHGLLQYYGTLKDAEKNIATTCKSIENLQQSFIIIERVLRFPNHSADVKMHLEQTVSMCEHGVLCLEKKLAKIKIHGERQDSKQWRLEFKKRYHTAMYPFRESTLIKLRDTCNAMHGNLSIALQLLQSDTSAKSFLTLQSMSANLKGMSLNIEDLERDFHSADISLANLSNFHQGK